MEELRAKILAGDFSASGMLPPERELCGQLHLSRGSLRMIFCELEAENLVRRIPGRGLKVLSAFERSPQKRILLVLPSQGIRGNELSSILKGAAASAEDNNAELVLFFLDKSLDCTRLAARIQETKWSGVVFLEQFPPGIAQALQNAACPYCVTNYEEEKEIPYTIRVDFRAVGRMAGRFLIQQGCHEIGFIGRSNASFPYKEMLAGFKGALAEEDFAPSENLTLRFDEEKEDDIVARIKNVLKKPAAGKRGIFAGRNRWARYIYIACDALALRIPEDIAVVGYDGISWDEAVQKGLPTIPQPTFDSGWMAVCSICKLADSGTEIPLNILVPPISM